MNGKWKHEERGSAIALDSWSSPNLAGLLGRARGRGFPKFMLCVNDRTATATGMISVPILTLFENLDQTLVGEWSSHKHTQDPFRRLSASGALNRFHNSALLWENNDGRISIPSAKLTSSETDTMHLAYDHGVVTGVNIPLCIAGVHAKVIVSFFSSHAIADLAEVDDTVAILFYLAHCIHEELSPRLPIHGSDTPALSPRERECLDWVAKGKTAAEIASILNLSVETVRDHIKSMRGKLGARTKAEAVARAGRAN
jgi:DNA-binding CsgD family transcriptional regulator